MMRHRALVALALWPLACSSGRQGGADGGVIFPPQPFMTLASQSGQLSIALFSAPEQPPPRGVDVVRFAITDKSGKPVDGLQLSVQPWMAAMGHGTSVSATVTAEGAGLYDVSNLDLVMPGTWDLKTTIAGSVTDSCAPAFDVQ